MMCCGCCWSVGRGDLIDSSPTNVSVRILLDVLNESFSSFTIASVYSAKHLNSFSATFRLP
jgi:hypothetical protein